MADLLQEAIADAKKVKEMAYENAKVAIEEAFQPRIQRMISSKLAEMDDEMPPAAGIPPEEEEEIMASEQKRYHEDGKDGLPASNNNLREEELDEEFQAILRELEASGNLDEMGGEMPPPLPTDDMPGEEEEGDELELESLIRSLEEGGDIEEDVVNEKCEDGHEKAGAGKKNTGMKAESVHSLRSRVKQLTTENAKAHQAIATMKAAMNEVNLLNAKLMFSSKVMRSFELSESQQVKILESFDRANSLREVKLVYTTILENYNRKKRGQKPATARTMKRNITEGRKKLTENASRRVPKGPRRKRVNENADKFAFAPRWQILAGMKPLED